MPCLFRAIRSKKHCGLILVSVATFGLASKSNQDAFLSEITAQVPVLRRLSSKELYSLLLNVTVAVCLGGHVEHSILSEACLALVYEVLKGFPAQSDIAGKLREDILDALTEEGCRTDDIEDFDVSRDWHICVGRLCESRFMGDFELKLPELTRDRIVHFSDELADAYGEAYFQPSLPVFTDKDLKNATFLARSIENPACVEEELVPRVLASRTLDGFSYLIDCASAPSPRTITCEAQPMNISRKWRRLLH